METCNWYLSGDEKINRICKMCCTCKTSPKLALRISVTAVTLLVTKVNDQWLMQSYQLPPAMRLCFGHCLSVCLFVCEHNYANSFQAIFMKCRIMEYFYEKNTLNFAVDPTVMHWCYWQGTGLAIHRSWVRVLAVCIRTVALGKLLTPL